MFEGFQADDDFAFPFHIRFAFGGGDAGAFQFQAAGTVIAAAQLNDIAAKFTEQPPFGDRLGGFWTDFPYSP